MPSVQHHMKPAWNIPGVHHNMNYVWNTPVVHGHMKHVWNTPGRKEEDGNVYVCLILYSSTKRFFFLKSISPSELKLPQKIKRS